VPSTSEPPHLSAEEFRRRGYALVDWVADYLERVEGLPVRALVDPGWVRAQLPPDPPEAGEPFESVLADLDRIVVPALTHWQHPGFFAYFPANASGPAILADLLSAGLGVQGMLWQTSPAATELETHMLDWLAVLLDLPPGFRSDADGGGVIQDSASSATLCALVAARERAEARNGAALVVYATPESHSSVEKAMRVTGLGAERLVLVDADERGRMRPDALAEEIRATRAGGDTPCAVVATVGTTSAGAVDPVRAIGEVCRREGLWLHVDAAWAGVAAVCPEHRWIHDGLELADSYVTNPHKWLLTNFDCSAFYVADRSALVGALTVLPEYLRNTASESGAVIDYRDWQIPLGRRFRALKLWFVIRHYGGDGLRAHIRRHVALAGTLAERVAAHRHLELAAEPVLGLVCLRHRGGDAATEALLDRLNRSGRVYLTHTRVRGALVIRAAVGGARTTAAHVDDLWTLIDEHAAQIAQADGIAR
jgi:aromatic-L-amino-acid/L-tryptophan decarboxylase